MTEQEIKSLPKEFDFTSKINPLNITYHATETAHGYTVTGDRCEWLFGKSKMHSHLLNGDFVIKEDKIIIEVPSWCKIGMYIKWYAPLTTGLNDWVREQIVGYGYNGFFHQAPNCPLYYTEFSEYGKTVKLEEDFK